LVKVGEIILVWIGEDVLGVMGGAILDGPFQGVKFTIGWAGIAPIAT
jgi:hypothetical protein